MGIIISHLVRLGIDFGLLLLMHHLEIYELTDVLVLLIAIRIIVGHFGRIFQYIIGYSDDMKGFAVGIVANLIKTFFESAILLNLYDDISLRVAFIVIVCILARNTFEAVALCEEFGE